MIFWRALYLNSLKCLLPLFMAMSLVACSSEIAPIEGTAVFEWQAPTIRVDGTAIDPSTEIDSYNIYYGIEKGVYLG